MRPIFHLSKHTFGMLLLFCLLFALSSCEKETLVTSDDTRGKFNESESFEKRVCGNPSAPGTSEIQSCNDVSSPINVGRLDCRATTPRGAATAGYREWNNRGVYTIYGGFTADQERSVRVERRFPNFARGVNKTARFRAWFKISDLSTSHTYIAQTHGSKNVIGYSGGCNNRKHTSAMYLLRVERNPWNSNQYDVYREETSVPFASGCTGSRTKTFLRTINRNEDYYLEIVTGYNSSQDAYVRIQIGNDSWTKKHPFNTQEMYFRYGAYNASKSGSNFQRKSVVRFGWTEYCHP